MTSDNNVSDKTQKLEISMAEMGRDVGHLTSDVKEIKALIKELTHTVENNLDTKYVTKEEFKQVKSIVYGIVATVGLAVIGSLMKSILL